MNFKKIINMQKELDNEYKKNNAFENSLINEKRIAAILVEIGEFANEYAPFKYWKKNIKIDKTKILEEFVDGIHFFASLINKFEINVNNVKFKIINNDKTIQLIHTFKMVSNLYENLNKQSILNAFEVYLGNAILLDIKFLEIEDAYIKKNEINFKRIKNGY